MYSTMNSVKFFFFSTKSNKKFPPHSQGQKRPRQIFPLLTIIKSSYFRTRHQFKGQTSLLHPDSAQDIVWTASLKSPNPFSLFRTSIIHLGGNNRKKKGERGIYAFYNKATKHLDKIRPASRMSNTQSPRRSGRQHCSRLPRPPRARAGPLVLKRGGVPALTRLPCALLA